MSMARRRLLHPSPEGGGRGALSAPDGVALAVLHGRSPPGRSLALASTLPFGGGMAVAPSCLNPPVRAPESLT